jgi:nucleoid-associated protein YgaU
LTGHNRVAKVAQPNAVGAAGIGDHSKGRNVTNEVKSSAKPVVLGGVVAAVVGLGVFAFLPQTQVPDAVPDAPAVEEIAAVAPPAPLAAPEPVTQPDPAIAEAPVETIAPDVVVAAPAEPVTPAGPQFDTFRVEADGAMVIAGRAEPGQVVDIMLAGAAIERVTANQSGNFVALPMAGPSEQPRRLSLVADPEGLAVASETSYMVAPIAAPVVVATIEEIVAEPATLAAPQEPDLPIVADEPAAAPTVLQADADGVRVVQDTVADNVALDAITYDPDGEVQLAGRATGDGAVQVYIDNQPLTASPVTEGGDWQIELPQIDTGVYTLRIDEVDAEGDVVSRLETPFKREEPQEVAAVLAEETAADGFEVAVKTVQPGATLWAIAEENLGSGVFYVAVFEANRDLIRDPDLIYPGQIFRIPEITQ